MMEILVIDGQGGGMGARLVEAIKALEAEVTVAAVGTNVIATQAMLRAGADHGATGENALCFGCRRADVIVGPVGIVIADSLWGEISPAMATAVGQSSAVKVLIPVNQCSNIIAGASGIPQSKLIESAISEIRKILEK